jgi:hypothetical protein
MPDCVSIVGGTTLIPPEGVAGLAVGVFIFDVAAAAAASAAIPDICVV